VDHLHAFEPAFWRCTTPMEGVLGGVGVAFETLDGRVIRLRFGREETRHLVETLTEGLQASRCHSDKSLGIPSEPVSTPQDGVQV
jgi:hypothetical protein